MNRSTGGLVLLDKTSLNDGSLFLRLFAQSSCCFSSPSILAGASNAAGPAVSALVGVGDDSDLVARPAELNFNLDTEPRGACLLACPSQPVSRHHVVCKSLITCTQRNTHIMLPEQCGFSGDTVCFQLHHGVHVSYPFLADNLSFQITPQ